MESIEKIFEAIDRVNEADAKMIEVNGKMIAKELTNGRRMSTMLTEYNPAASEALQIAVRGLHIKRFHIARSSYAQGRVGYLSWRSDLKKFHGKLLAEILTDLNAGEPLLNRVVDLVNKRQLKTNSETQELEDVACLVFLKYDFSGFADLHEDEKVISIIKKTWMKMSDKGREFALKQTYETKDLKLIQQAIA